MFSQQIFRATPKMPTGSYETFAIRSPITTHFRPANCKEVDCPGYLNGWSFRESDLDAQLMHIVTTSGRRYRRIELGPGEFHLVFEAGQPCFDAPRHKLKLDRPEFFYAGRGDWRSFSTRRATRYDRSEDWLDKFANDLDKLKTEIEKG